MKTKVLMIDMCGWGGLTHYTYNLMQALAAGGVFDPALLTDSSYELEGLPRNFKIIERAFRGRPYIPAVFALIREIFMRRPGIIHVQSGLSARKDCFIFALARLSGASIVYTAHNVLPHEESEKRAFFMRFWRALYSAFFTACGFMSTPRT